MLAMIFNFLLSRLKRSCENIAARSLRIHIRRIAEDLKLQGEFEQIALTSIAESLKSGISERTHNKLTKTLTTFANIACSPVHRLICSNPPPELQVVYTELAKVTPTRKKPAPRTSSPLSLPPSCSPVHLFTGSPALIPQPPNPHPRPQ